MHVEDRLSTYRPKSVADFCLEPGCPHPGQTNLPTSLREVLRAGRTEGRPAPVADSQKIQPPKWFNYCNILASTRGIRTLVIGIFWLGMSLAVATAQELVPGGTTPPIFQLEEDVLPAGPGTTSCIPYCNNGRQITRNKAGVWFLVQASNQLKSLNPNAPGNFKTWLMLSISKTGALEGRDFNQPIWLAGKDQGMFPANGIVGMSCAVMDQQDRLHIFYDDDHGVIFEIKADASGDNPYARLQSTNAWSKPRTVAVSAQLGDVVALPSGKLLVYYKANPLLYEKELGTNYAAKIEAGTNSSVLVASNASYPSVYVDREGTRHLAYESGRRIFYVRCKETGKWTDSKGQPSPEQVTYANTFYPSLAGTGDGKLVIAYRGEGQVYVKGNPDPYPEVRGNGGSTVSYAVFANGKWTIHDLARSREILLNQVHLKPVTSPVDDGERWSQHAERTFKPFIEEFWSPTLAVDRHGVIWLFYVNTTRRHVYFSRFQGETFGDRFEARGPYDCLTPHLLVQKDSMGQSHIGFVTLAGWRLYFDALMVPGYSSDEARRILFLDNLEVDELVGMEHGIGVFKKRSEPVFGYKVSGTNTDDQIVSVDVQSVEGGFTMKYSSLGQELNYTKGKPGNAFSKDGIHWEKLPPDLRPRTMNGNPGRGPMSYIEDAGEKDPQKRFKGIIYTWEFIRNIDTRGQHAVTSPDGLNWKMETNICAIGDTGCHVYIDPIDKDPRRRYKAWSTAFSCSGRNVCMYTSPDGVNWSGVRSFRIEPESVLSPLAPYPTGMIVLDPDGGEGQWEEEIHGARDMGFIHGMHLVAYDSFYLSQNQHVGNRLAMSRDGKHYYRVKRGATVIDHGNCGEWDNGRLHMGEPLRVGDELRCYYVGMSCGGGHLRSGMARPYPWETVQYWGTVGPSQNEGRQWKANFATMRVDGWGFLRLNRDAQSGYMTTIPFDYRGGKLVVNGTGLGNDGITVEIRTADNKSVVPGYEAKSCEFSAADGIDVRVTWKKSKPLPSGNYRLRFIFENLRSQLYSFGFEDGQKSGKEES